MGIMVSIENDVPEQRIKGGIKSLTGVKIDCWDFDLLPPVESSEGETFSRRTKGLLPGETHFY